MAEGPAPEPGDAADPELAEADGRGGGPVGWETPTPETWLQPASTATSSNGDIRVDGRTVTNRT